MSVRGGFVLLGSSLLNGTNTPFAQWVGGRTALVIQATSWPGAPSQMVLQMQAQGSSVIAIASSFVADQIFPFDAPPGQYRLSNQSGSTVVGVTATFIGITYT